MKFPTADELAATPTSKGELAEKLYSGMTYDCALPQSWLDDATARGMDTLVGGWLASHFITLYPDSGVPYIAPITADGVKIVAILASVK